MKKVKIFIISILSILSFVGTTNVNKVETKAFVAPEYKWQEPYEKRNIGYNKYQRYKYDQRGIHYKNVKYVIQGTSGISAQQMYDAIPPLTWSEARNLAYIWNGMSSSERMVISVEEDSSCRWNPSYCNWKSYYKGYHKATKESPDDMWIMVWD